VGCGAEEEFGPRILPRAIFGEIGTVQAGAGVGSQLTYVLDSIYLAMHINITASGTNELGGATGVSLSHL
jgi:hypothetical protein